MTYYFTNSEKAQIIEEYKSGANLIKLGQKFGCSCTPIERILCVEFECEEHNKIAKNRLQKNGTKRAKNFSPSEKVQIIKGFKNGISLGKLAQKFEYSVYLIRRHLIAEFGLASYKKLATEHLQKAGQEVGRKTTIRHIKDGTAGSSWEDKFLEKILLPNFKNYTIKRWYFPKGSNHPYDFAILECKILIEIDGDYYHGHSGYTEWDHANIEKDIKNTKWAKQNGWILFRYNDNDLKKMDII